MYIVDNKDNHNPSVLEKGERKEDNGNNKYNNSKTER